MPTQPSFANVPPSKPVNRAWVDAADRERFWFQLSVLFLVVLTVAILFWQRTTPNVALEVALCLATGFAGSRHSKASRARARLTPVPPSQEAARPAQARAPALPLLKAPRA